MKTEITELIENIPLDMLSASEQLQDLMADSIRAAGGWVSFDKWMAQALYTPQLGYYSGLYGIGEGADFITAPEISPLFSQVVARQLLPVLSSLKLSADSELSILEFGAGSGVMAADILLELERCGELPQSYKIIELSAALRSRQQQTLKERAPHLLQRVEWLNELPEEPFNGVVIANEVMDAIPFERFVIRDGRAVALGVGLKCSADESGESEQCILALQENPAALLSPSLLSDNEIDEISVEGYSSELRPALSGWINSIADTLHSGMVLLLDYGYSRKEYYRPERSSGSLSCFYRHHQHTDALVIPGLQDITAHVDFTAVAEAADEAGLRVAGFSSQSYFLLAGGIAQLAEEELAKYGDDDLRQRLKVSQAIQQLTLPAQMGEVVKVMGLTKNVDLPETFTQHDILYTL